MLPLLGRETRLAELNELISSRTLPLITIVGPGGVGKTRLALESAWNQLPYFQDGVFFVPLAGLQDPQALASTIGQAVSFTFHNDTPQEAQLLDFFRHKESLLVIDNFEHLLSGVDLLLALLRGSPGLNILTTSRTALGAQIEQCFPLTGLTFPAETGLMTNYQAYGALQLFEDSARRLKPDFLISPANVIDIIRI
jgi:predicted ATPase